jgi:hypothetical protein
MCECEHQPEYEPDWQPHPDKPGWLYDAKNGPPTETSSLRAYIPVALWRQIYEHAVK